MKVAFITRTKAKNEKSLSDKDQESLRDLIKEVDDSDIIIDKYIISNFKHKDYMLKIKNKLICVQVVKDENPTGPTSINTVLNKIKIKTPEEKPDAFLVCSKEVRLKKKHIKILIDEIKSNENFLVVGYKFKIVNKTGRVNKKLNKELQDDYDYENLIAYKVPWNTCAIWKYEHFEQYVKKFDEITARNPFNSIGISIDGNCSKTEHKGMEDGLAIAAAADINKNLKFKLLDDEELGWEVDLEPDRVKSHREKLARKDTVLRNFMAVRNYSVNDLENADIKNKQS